MTRQRMPGPRGRVVVGTEIVALGVIGFSANCLVVMANTIGIEKQNPGALARGWGLIHIFLGIMMVVVGVATVRTSAVLGNDVISGFFGIALAWVVLFLLWPGTHGKAGALKVNAYLLIILALLVFYIAFGFFFPGFPGGALPF